MGKKGKITFILLLWWLFFKASVYLIKSIYCAVHFMPSWGVRVWVELDDLEDLFQPSRSVIKPNLVPTMKFKGNVQCV